MQTRVDIVKEIKPEPVIIITKGDLINLKYISGVSYSYMILEGNISDNHLWVYDVTNSRIVKKVMRGLSFGDLLEVAFPRHDPAEFKYYSREDIKEVIFNVKERE